MKFVLASWGSRGEVEPCAAVGRELLRRGHDVWMAVPPDLVEFGSTVVPNTVPFGSELRAMMDGYREFWTRVFHRPWQLPKLREILAEMSDPLIDSWGPMSATLTELADGADLLLNSAVGFELLAANVAEHYDIPLALLHWFPMRPNGQLAPYIPASVCRAAMATFDALSYGGWARQVEQEQRRALGLPPGRGAWPKRVLARDPLELQAYDEACFPGLAAEWADWNAQSPPRRPFIGALTVALSTAEDAEVLDWATGGSPPIFFGFGSMPVESPAETVAMIAAVSERLGERALVCAGWEDFGDVPRFDHVKVVGAVNFAEVFGRCRALVHHGGAGTTALGLRAGVPTLVLSTDANQALWGAQLRRLGLGAWRRFGSTTERTLLKDLRRILTPEYQARAREFAGRMNTPSESASTAAEYIERFAVERRRVGRSGPRRRS
ncbi:glycosyltransferase [uncultured Mycolicibacterium sp.]|uniref:glycosyltransferase n=1 Tax=uncultured Mycolicibacterium sp. TaxID=2320817 RepID=UPI0026328F90|nr:glycosyltransferase [uncultured Mycolicibacterium sp.]